MNAQPGQVFACQLSQVFSYHVLPVMSKCIHLYIVIKMYLIKSEI